MSNAATVNTCSGTFYDSGGASGSYSDNESFTRTFCSDQPGSQISLTFTSFTSEQCCDHLYIYDGPTTGGALLAQAEGTSPAIIVGQVITSSTGGCLTIKWTSDGSVTNTGWVALISCTFPCQPFNITIDNPSTPFYNGDTIRICQNTPLTLNVTGSYPTAGTNYAQSDATTLFHWTFGDGSTPGFAEGIGLTSVTHTWSEGAYYVTLDGTDINNCTNSNLARIMILVSLTPDFSGTYISPDTICPGETTNLVGSAPVINPWAVTIDTMVAGLTYLPDGQGTPYETTITNTLFIPGQTMTSVSDIVSVCLNIEHSYVGDLTISLICPSGETLGIITYSNGYGSTYFGTPIDDDSNTAPGVGATYCWTPTATGSLPVTSGSTAPPGNYSPSNGGNFNTLLGCMLNGDWTIHVEDHLGSDNGYIFWWQLHFNPNIIPPQFSFTTTANDSTLFSWTENDSNGGLGAQVDGLADATPTTSGTHSYTFHVLDNYNCEYDTTGSVFVLPVIDPSCCVMPTPNAGIDSAVCSMQYTLNATLAAGNTGSWTVAPGAPGTATIANPLSQNSLVTVNTWGTYYFVWSETYNSAICTQTDTVAITFNETPTSTFTVSSIPCYGDSTTVTYTGNAAIAGSDTIYVWDFGGVNNWISQSGNNQGPFAGTWSTPATYDITLQVIQNGCYSPITTVPVILPSALEHSNTIVHNLCYGESLGSIEITTNGGTLPYNYSWASGVSILNNLAAGTYDVTVTDANACNFSESITITHPTYLSIDTAYKNIDCFGGNDGFISITAQDATLPYTFTYDPVMSNSPLQNNLQAGTYPVTVSDANGCDTTFTFILSQPPQLILSVSDGDALCFGVSITMTADGVGGTPSYTYLWNGSANTQSITVTPTVTSTYVVQLQDMRGCLSNQESIEVIVSPLMNGTLTLQNNKCFNSCDGSALYQVSGGILPLEYSWPGGQPLLEGLCAGLFSVTVTDQIGCFVDTSFVITQPPPITYMTETTPATCYGYNNGSATVTVQGGTQPYWYFWSNGSNMATATNLFAGTYNCVVTDANGCNVNPYVTITQPPRVYVSSSDDQQICIGGSVNISAQVMGGTPPYSYYWVGDSSIYTGPVVNADPILTSTYALTVTDRNGCVGNLQEIVVNVYPPLSLNAFILVDTICPGKPVSLRADVSGGNGGPYMIYLNNGTLISPPVDVFPMESQTYTLTLHDRCETPTVVDSVRIEVLPLPPNNPLVDQMSGCVPLTLQFIETSPNEGQVYAWVFGDGVNSEGSVSKNPTHTFNYPGTYYVSLTVTSQHGCTNIVTMEMPIEVHPLPEARFVPKPDVVSIVDPKVDFYNYSSGSDTCFWVFGDGDSSLIFNPSHYYKQAGTYEVKLIARTEFDCRDTSVQKILVREEYTVYAPTAFSPNNDSKNDYFEVYNHGIHPEGYHLLIYNRWGEIVFETKDKDKKWDGKYKGDIVSSDVYTWVLYYRNLNGMDYTRSGHVTVIR